jgi:hypothetical protein
MSSTTNLPKPSDKPADPFARGSIPGAERILCLNAADGKVLWRMNTIVPTPSATRLARARLLWSSDGKVFTLGAEGNLFCLDAATGGVVWSRDFKQDYNIKTPMWGFAGNPLLDGNKTDLPGWRLQLHGGRVGQKHRPGNLAGFERQGAGLLFPRDF